MQQVNMPHPQQTMADHPSMGPRGDRLSESQREILSDILSRYDPNNFSAADEANMQSELKAASIFPGRELGTALEKAGFEIERPPAPPIGGGMRPQQGGIQLSDEQKSILEEILSRYDPENFSPEDDRNMKSELEAAGIFPGKELGHALNRVGFELKIAPAQQLPNGIIIDNQA